MGARPQRLQGWRWFQGPRRRQMDAWSTVNLRLCLDPSLARAMRDWVTGQRWDWTLVVFEAHVCNHLLSGVEDLLRNVTVLHIEQ